MSLNVELIKQIRRDVLAFPEHFDMSHWIKPAPDREFIPTQQIVDGDFMEIDNLVGSCGTTACIAGWAILHGRDRIPSIIPTLPGSPSELGHDRLMHHLGAALLGIRIGIFATRDHGASWDDFGIGRFSAPMNYCRDLVVCPHDPQVMYACQSASSRGTVGSLYRTADAGRSWQRIDHGFTASSGPMNIS